MTRVLAALLAVSCLADYAWAHQPVRGRHGMVVAEEPIAAKTGVAVLKAGGNAIDAAIAVAFTLAVTYPSAGNIGGGGFLLARFPDGRTTFIDFREKAPQAATRDMYLDAQGKPTRDSIQGWRASAVPGTVRGLALAHRKYGRKRWSRLLAPAIQLARTGFPVPYSLAESLASAQTSFAKGIETGDKLIQRDLARTLARIARKPDDFYTGVTARQLAASMAKNGGLITPADLKAYRPVERTPLTGSYKGFGILTAPPPSSGGVGILQMLGVLEGSGYEKEGWNSAATIHYVAETMRRFYADRSEYIGDPDFSKIPVKALIHPEYVRKLRSTIDPNKVSTITPGVIGPYESTETTHFSIVDNKGTAVAVTYTLNGSYGSGVVAPGLGFLLNNEMDDFAARPGSPNMFGLVQGERNAIQPGKRPLSSMTPTILTRNGKLYMVLGSPGGGRIITAVLQTILNVVDFGMNVQDAIDAPRFHHQWMPDHLTLERGFSPDTTRLLERRGHKLNAIAGVGRVSAIVVDGGWLQGGADGRGYGKAEGF
ncbi:MAG TPA: gamma-glutamyltransferase [Bryobacteraceae bacterium]|nr:gamma-glutamyltransferase [Bryobacteraceae bacterium]